MKVNYIVEYATHDLNNFWRWKQIYLCETLEDAKKVCGDRHRVLDAHTLKEVYRTAPNNHFGIMAKVSGY